jgi:solute carrier family 25 carnitine/acylcarnitine transporter 20/29
VDTIKNKMQAQEGFEARNAVNSLIKTLRAQGIYGLYRGATPQFIGSMAFRSTQFGVYNSVHGYLDTPLGRTQIPLITEVRVVAGGMMAGLGRALLETPIDYWKIRRQIVKKWEYKEALSGLKVTVLSRVFLLPAFFIYLEKFKPFFSENPLGTFLQTGTSATAAWFTLWPLEYMKSQIQGKYGDSNLSLLARLRGVVREKGFFALYRGFGPGSVRSFTANGLSMIALKWTEKHLTEYFG